RGDRARPPDRHVRCPPGADAHAGAAAPRRRAGRGGSVRGRRPGRRAAAACAAELTVGIQIDAPASPPVDTLVKRARAGDPRAVARLISLVESGHPCLPDLAAALAPHTGAARVIGLTGAQI